MERIMEKLRVKRFGDHDTLLPTRAYPTDAGLDFYAPFDFVLFFGEKVAIPSGFGVALDPGFVGLFIDKSSIGGNGVKIFGGVIDANYRGEIMIMLAYLTGEPGMISFKKGQKIAQMIITRAYTPEVIEVNEFEKTDRGSNGFGSTEGNK